MQRQPDHHHHHRDAPPDDAAAAHRWAVDPVLAWSDRLLLGFPEIDAEHREFVDRVRALQLAGAAAVASRLDEFAAHARHHFATEDAWMVETGFPPRQCHIDEHAAVLKSVAEVQALVAAGNTAVVRSLADELARWFPAHADHLDSALAAWMCKQRFDAKPLVLRRGVASGGADRSVAALDGRNR